MGDAVSVGPGALVTMNCTFPTAWTGSLQASNKTSNACIDKYNDSTKKYDQTVSLDGKVVSRISTGKQSHL